jgi:sterol 3beta-glucosyltransferase
MKAVLLALGSRGDVQPMVALGRELHRRRVPVLVVALRDFAPLVTEAGLPFHPIERTMAESRAAAGPAGSYRRRVTRWLDGIGPQVADAELAAVEPGDLIVAGLLSFDDAAALARARGCTVVHALFAPLLPSAYGGSTLVSMRRTGHGRLNSWAGLAGIAAVAGMCTTTGRALRARLGLPATSARDFVRLVCATPSLVAVSPLLVPAPPDRPEHVWQTGAWLSDEPAWTPPDDLAAFLAAGPAPVFLSLGSAPGADPAADLDLMVRAALGSGCRAVIGAPWQQAPALPPSVHVLRDAPYRWLFPRMSAVVHHGGAGTTAEALLAAVPNAVVAVAADQPFYGRRIHELGIGPAPVRRRHLSARRLAALVADLSGDRATAYRTAAGQARDRLRAERGVENAADRIAALLAGQPPGAGSPA